MKREGVNLRAADEGDKAVKNSIVYTNLSQMIWLSHTMKQRGYELVDLPYAV